MRDHRNELNTLQEVLSSKKEELRARIEQRRTEIMVDRDPDDEGAHAVDRNSRDFAAFNMEREMHTLAEIDLSLRRIAMGEYGVCNGCGTEIPMARLQAIPWTRLCVKCAAGGVQSDLGSFRPIHSVAIHQSSSARVARSTRP
jgi:DnaK suppressor protein